MERLPGSAAWVLAHIDLRTEAALRSELRRLRRELDAMFAALWIVAPRKAESIAFAGECRVAPSPYPAITSAVPSFERVRGADGDEHEAVLFPPQLGRGMARLGLIVVDTADIDRAVVFDTVEACGERLEKVIVSALS